MGYRPIQERSNFEHVARVEGWRLDRYDVQSDGVGKYIDPATQRAYEAWVARAKSCRA